MIGCIIIACSIMLSAFYLGAKLNPNYYNDEAELADLYAVATDDRPEVVEDESDRPEDYGSDELKKFIDEFDNRIESLKEELGSEYQQIKSTHRAGVVFDEDHSVVDSQYIAIPKEEYAK